METEASHTHDVIVVGGGPAGATCARALVQQGLRVAVVDRQTFPRDKICAGWVTPAAVAALGLDLIDYAHGRTLQPITGFVVSLLGGVELDTRYDEVISYGIRRCEFDHYLLERSGADLHLGRPIKALAREAGGWRVNELSAPLLIGAGGHFCPVARHLGTTQQEPIIAAQELEFPMGEALRRRCPIRPDRPELYFFEDMQGYAWCVRKGDHLNVGLGRIGNNDLAGWRDAFADFLERSGKLRRDDVGKLKGHAYLLWSTSPRRIIDDRALLIGDAAGLADDMSGEGIRTAIESALLAAETIQACRGRYTPTELAPYAVRLTERFGPRGPQGIARLSKALPPAITGPIARFLMGQPWFARHVIVDRWFLHRERPPMRASTAGSSGPARSPRSERSSAAW